MSENEKNQDSVRAVDRALDILMAFQPGDFELTMAELLKRVSLSRPTLYRLVGTLENKGFLESSGDPQRFRLGSSIAHLSHVWSSSLRITEMAEPMMRRLWEATRETVALFVPRGHYRLCVAEMPSPQPLSFKRGMGYQERLVLGASGRTILAHMDLEATGLAEAAANLSIDLKALSGELEAIRSRGIAVSRDALIQGAVAVAVPFFDASNRIAGSMCIFGPGVRLSDAEVEKFGQLLIQEAALLSQALGFRGRA